MNHVFTKLGLVRDTQSIGLQGEEMAQRVRVPIDEAVKNYKIMTEMADRTIIILPPFSLEELRRIEPYNQTIAHSLKDHASIVRFPKMELTSPESKEYFVSDGFHPNEYGASYMANHLKDLILQNK